MSSMTNLTIDIANLKDVRQLNLFKLLHTSVGGVEPKNRLYELNLESLTEAIVQELIFQHRHTITTYDLDRRERFDVRFLSPPRTVVGDILVEMVFCGSK